MAKKELTLTIRAKNALKAGLGSAGKALTGFAKRAGKLLSFSGLIGGITGLATSVFSITKAMQGWADQDRATRSLSSALESMGENASVLIPKLQKVADAIQDETGVSDNAVTHGMARLAMLGVTSDKLEAAAKATIALKSAGMAEAQAARAVAAAYNGQYTMLQRYLPALKDTSDAAEKAKIVNDFLTKGYQQQKDVLQTVGGQWGAFKGRVGDVLEEIGRAIDKSGGIRTALERAGDAVKNFGQAIADWIDSDRFKELQSTIQAVVNAMQSSEGRKEVGKATWEYFKSVLRYGADVLKAAGDYIGQKIRAGAIEMVHGERRAADAHEAAAIKWSSGMSMAAARLQVAGNKLKEAVDNHRPAEGTKETPKQEPETINLVDEAKIAAEEAAAAAVKATEERNAEIAKLNQDREKLEKQHLDEMLKLQEKAAADEWALIKENAEKELAEKEKLAAMTVAQFIQSAKDRAKENKKQQRQEDRDAKRAAVLQERLKAGGRLSQKQQEWLGARRAIDAAKKQVNELKEQIGIAKENLKQAQQANATLLKIETALGDNQRALNKLLKFG